MYTPKYTLMRVITTFSSKQVKQIDPNQKEGTKLTYPITWYGRSLCKPKIFIVLNNKGFPFSSSFSSL